ncbi:hypothetical protein HF072_11625 [Bacillus sp. RO3]|nr:hypothetical protein [Bacillus sp. RO3]
MGYIAPIPHHQYKQYQERELKVNKHPFTFLPVQPVKPPKNKSQAQQGETETTKPNTRLIKPNTSYKSFPYTPTSSKVMAKLTGKGTYFNEYV